MNFEKLEVYGFKSFADKTAIKLEEGITGIVGPNGCGKSNVADAIMWVLGEQSAKSLRGTSMQDVIFNGTETRKSLSYCEVSLYFNNKDKHLFDLEYEQVIITRKLFRSGESEYQLNKQPCRLKDIIDLLHQCGIGKEGYTVIGQGKVTQIMSAKPEDRRAVFEEATGIAQNKNRKAESERRLERVKDELQRYSDLIGEVENQLRPLSRQAEKTKEYNRLSEELKINEVNTYIYKRDSVDSEKKRISDNIAEISANITKVNEETESVKIESDKSILKSGELDSDLADANSRFLKANIAIESKNGEMRVIRERMSFLDTQINTANDEIDKNNATVKTYSLTVETNTAKIAESTEEIKALNADIEKARTDLAEIEGRIRLGDDRTDEIRRKMIDSLGELSNINLNKGSLSGELNGLLDRKSEVDGKLQELLSKKFLASDERDNSLKQTEMLEKKLATLKIEIANKENEIRSLNEDTSALANKIYTLDSATTALVTKQTTLSGIRDRYDGFQFSVKKLMTAANGDKQLQSKIKGVLASLVRTDKEYELALETSLGGAVQNVVTATPEDAKYLIEYLKRTGGGRITFLPVTSMKPRSDSPLMRSALSEKGAIGRAVDLVKYDKYYDNVISNLLGNTLIVDNTDSAVYISKKYSFSFKIVTLDGDLFSTQGSMTGGSKKTDFSGLLSNDREIEELSEKISANRTEIAELKKKKDKLIESLNNDSTVLEELNDSYQDSKQAIGILKEKIATLETSLSSLESDLATLSDSKTAVDAKIEFLSEKIKEISSGSEKLAGEKEAASLEAERSRTATESDKKARDGLNKEISDLRERLNELQSAKDRMETENGHYRKEIENLNNETKICEDNVSNLLASKEEFKKKLAEVELSKEEQELLDGINNEIKAIKDAKTALAEKMNELGERRQTLADSLARLTEQKSAAEISYEQVEADVKYLEGKVGEDYMLDYEGALRYKVEDFNVEEGIEKAKVLREKRMSLGAINGSAIEEYAELNARYQSMLAEKQDVEKADSDLREGIETLRDEILKTFNEGFKIINENFGKIFRQLFGGGKAMLELDYTDCEDPLEAGVEIRAEPPGKSLQKISLLSGGEKALTTIAILFAILKYKPMPFCVLDEIEAPLDDANVGRFASYLKNFSQETQFIVITHRKPTMELADSLFGVTMEEKGVSKTVSVKLSDAAGYDVS